MVINVGFPNCFIAFLRLSLLPFMPLAFVPRIERLNFETLFLFYFPLLVFFFITNFGVFPILVGFGFAAFTPSAAS